MKRLGRRRFLRVAMATAGLAPLAVRAELASAQGAPEEPWRKLIPRVPPPPTLPAPTPPGGRVDLAQFLQVCRGTAAGLARADGWVMPSGWYPMLFTRDAYWITAANRDPLVHGAVLARLRKEQHPDGQAPTALYIDGYNPPGRDNADECTLLFALMSYDAARLGGTVDRPSLVGALNYLRGRAPTGRYASLPGPVAYWLDTLALAGDQPSVTYVQGLHAVVLRALKTMGIPGAEPGPAEDAYRAAYDPDLGQLRCYADRDRRFGQLRDVSALAGEALSWYYFDRPLLDRAVVAATLESQPRAYYGDGAFLGFKNLTMADGSPLPMGWLSDWPANTPGNYQNGASWLLYDALALYAGVRHAIPGAARLLLDRLASETRRTPSLHEYLSTAPEDLGGSDPKRDGYGWNAFVGNLLESAGPL
ncbi:MAG TPA: hypothetical protein VFC93_03230 [Chloroflexota bacterium]|nr:hypothetical protein [Chloroflexota bacterium]